MLAVIEHSPKRLKVTQAKPYFATIMCSYIVSETQLLSILKKTIRLFDSAYEGVTILQTFGIKVVSFTITFFLPVSQFVTPFYDINLSVE